MHTQISLELHSYMVQSTEPYTYSQSQFHFPVHFFFFAESKKECACEKRESTPPGRARAMPAPVGEATCRTVVRKYLHGQADPADHRGVRALGPASGVRRR